MSGKNPLGQSKEAQAYEGVNVLVPIGGWQLIKSVRSPTSNDKKYPIGSIWINTSNNTAWLLTSAPGNWSEFAASVAGAIVSITGDSGGAESALLGNFNLLGTANQITVTGSANTETFSLPSAITAPGSLAVTTTLNVTGLSTLAAMTQVGTASINASGAGVTTIGTGGTGATNIGNATGNTAVTGSLTASTSLTATAGNITATNGNIVKGTAGNKDVYTSVATTTTAGANSAGTVTLVGGTATVATTAITAASKVRLTRQSVGATGAAALGELSIGTISAGVSFIINAWSQANATALATTDVSSIWWEIVN